MHISRSMHPSFCRNEVDTQDPSLDNSSLLCFHNSSCGCLPIYSRLSNSADAYAMCGKQKPYNPPSLGFHG